MRVLLLFAAVMLGGCTQIQMLPYLDQVLRLQELGREKDNQHKYVEGVDARFDKLQAQVKSGEVKKYKAEKDVVKAFGPPVLSGSVEQEGRTLKKSLYRYAIFSKGPHKVYVYYDERGRVERFESL